nr:MULTISPECIES: hypothetical protein [Sphingobacterium]
MPGQKDSIDQTRTGTIRLKMRASLHLRAQQDPLQRIINIFYTTSTIEAPMLQQNLSMQSSKRSGVSFAA